MNESERLANYLSNAGLWLRQAYLNDTTVHATLNECAKAGMEIEEAYSRLAVRLYSERNHFRDVALRYASEATRIEHPAPKL